MLQHFTLCLALHCTQIIPSHPDLSIVLHLLLHLWLLNLSTQIKFLPFFLNGFLWFYVSLNGLHGQCFASLRALNFVNSNKFFAPFFILPLMTQCMLGLKSTSLMSDFHYDVLVGPPGRCQGCWQGGWERPQGSSWQGFWHLQGPDWPGWGHRRRRQEVRSNPWFPLFSFLISFFLVPHKIVLCLPTWQSSDEVLTLRRQSQLFSRSSVLLALRVCFLYSFCLNLTFRGRHCNSILWQSPYVRREWQVVSLKWLID